MIVIRKLSAEEARKYFRGPGRPKADKKALDPGPKRSKPAPAPAMTSGECFVSPTGEHFYQPAIVGRSVITSGLCGWCSEEMEQPEGWKPYRS